MPDMATATDKLGALNAWLIDLDPRFKALLDSSGGVNGTIPAEAASSAAAPGGSSDAGPEKVNYDFELKTTELKRGTKYGELKVSFSAKVVVTVFGAGTNDSPIQSTTSITSKDKGSQRERGIKQNFSSKDFENLKLLDSLTLNDLTAGVETAFSGSEVTISGTFGFNITTAAFTLPATITLILLKAKEGESLKVLGLEGKIASTQLKFHVGAFEVTLKPELKASFIVDVKKVGAEVGKKVVENLAKEQVKKEVEREGVKLIAREAALQVVKDLGPIAFAFGVGLDIGDVLNTFTIAPKVAMSVDEKILGDLNERYQRAGTLGKIVLVTRNADRIAAALVASGVAGAVSGMGDLVLFKLLHLDRLADFGQAFASFKQILAAIPNIGEAAGNLILSNVIIMGIKLNPRYHTVKNAAFATITAKSFDTLHPLFKQPGGLDKIINTRLQDVDADEASMMAAIDFIVKSQLGYGSFLVPTDTGSAMSGFFDFTINLFMKFMEANHLITYSLNLNTLDVDSIDQSLVDEVFL